MKTYILIIIFSYFESGGTTSQEFSSLESCEKAKQWASQQYKHKKLVRVKAQCFEK